VFSKSPGVHWRTGIRGNENIDEFLNKMDIVIISVK